MFFRIEEVREIFLDSSKGKAEMLGMCAKIVLGWNGHGVIISLVWSKSVTKYAAGYYLENIFIYGWYEL